MSDATIIAASLNSAELERSIKQLVDSVKHGMDEIKNSVHGTVADMQRTLQGLGSIRVDSGGASDGGSSRRTKILQDEVQAGQQVKKTYDEIEQAKSKALTPSTAQESFNTFIQHYRQQMVAISHEIKQIQGTSLDRQFSEYQRYEQEIEKARRKIAELREELVRISKDPSSTRVNSQEVLRQIETLELKIKQLTAEQIQSTDRIANNDKRAIDEKISKYAQLGDEIRALTIGEKDHTETIFQSTSAAKQYTEEVRKQAQAIRESEEFKKTGKFNLYDDRTGNLAIISSESRRSIEQQVLEFQKANTREIKYQTRYEQQLNGETSAVGEQLNKNVLTEEERNQKEKEHLASLWSEGDLIKKNAEARVKAEEEYASVKRNIANTSELSSGFRLETTIDGLNQLKQAYKSLSDQDKRSPFGKELKGYIEQLERSVVNLQHAMSDESLMAKNVGDSYNELSRKLTRLKTVYDSMSDSGRGGARGQKFIAEMQQTEQALSQIRRQAMRPINLEDAFKGAENTIESVTRKIQRLKLYKEGLDFNTQAGQISQVTEKIRKLETSLTKYMSQANQVKEINNALARSWNYMKNRLAFYFTVGASTQFVKQLVEIRGQYEMTERALGVLVDSAQKGTQIFNELSQMALVSPYTLIELSNAARQMTAYGTAAKDVVDVTRRVADMAAAVGAPIERLTYALGHVQTYGYLTSLQARQFINAGVPIVKELASLYSEMEGRMISVADVYDRMKKKAVSYNDVLKVVNSMTDEGGRFFDFQAKMADTLKVQLANLTLAWNNMLNDIGKSSQGMISNGLKIVKDLLLHWRDLERVTKTLMWSGFITWLSLVIAKFNTLNTVATWNTLIGKKLTGVFLGLGRAFKSMAWTIMRNPWVLAAAAAITTITGLVIKANEAKDAIEELNKSISQGATESSKSIDEYLHSVDDTVRTLKNGGTLVGNDLTKAWESVRGEIEQSSNASRYFIANLEKISDLNVRVKKGFEYLREIQDVQAFMSQMAKDAIKVNQEWSAWWNLNLAADGLFKNFQQYERQLDFVKNINEYTKTAEGRDQLFLLDINVEDAREKLDSMRETLENDISDTVASMYNKFAEKAMSPEQMREAFELSLAYIVKDANLSADEIARLRIKFEDSYVNYSKEKYDERIRYFEASGDWIRLKETKKEKEAFLERFGENQAIQEQFFSWLSRTHKNEVDERFKTYTDATLNQYNWESKENKKWQDERVDEFARANGYAFDDLKEKINNANTWMVNIPVYFDIRPQKNWIQEEVDERLSGKGVVVPDNITNLSKYLEDIAKQVKEDKKELEDMAAAGIKSGEHYNEILNDQKKNQEILNAFNYVSDKDKKAAAKAQRQAESELQKALKEELSLIDKVRSTYKTLTKEGVDSTRALTESTSGYNETVAAINKTFEKFGLARLDLTKYAGVQNPREIMNMLQKQLNALVGRAKPAEIKELQTKIKDLKIDSITFDQKKLVESMNNSLGKIKDEYELAVELDADPELGSMFTQMFGIDVDTLPKTFGEAFDRANEVAKDKLKELNLDIKDFDLLSTSITPDKNKQWMGLDFESEPVKELVKWQNTWRDIFKKNVTETEKMLDDYVKKYGDYSDKIAEIESERLEKISKLNNEYYNEEMRKRLEYISKLTAINNGAEREKSNAWFEEFKNSRYYTMMFENLDYISTKTIRDMRDKLRELMNDMNQLTPEQLKQVISQYEKLEEKLAKRSPFGSLGRSIREYFRTMSDRKTATKEFSDAQKEYDAQLKIVAAQKEKKEQLEHNRQIGTEEYTTLLQELGVSQEILDILKEQLDAAEKKYNKYNLIKKEALKEAAATAQMVATNLQSMGELRDLMQDTWGVALDENINGMVDGMVATGEGINKIVSSATSGDVVGVIVGVGKAVTGVADAFGSIFGGGMKDTYTPFIETMQGVVDALDRINDRLLSTLSKMNGARALEYYDKIVANDQRIEQQYREAARRYGESGSSWKSHSHEYNTNKWLKYDWDEISRVAGQEVRAIQDFYTLSSTQLEDIMLGLPNIWMKIDEEQRQWFEKIIEMQDEAEEHAKGLSQALTGIDIDSLSSDFESLIRDITKKFDDAGDNVTEILRNAVIRGLMVKTYAAELEKWQNTFDAYMGDGVLSPQEAEYLKNWYLDIAKRAMSDRDSALGALGLEDNKKELSNLQQGIQGITEETAGALEAYMNGVSQQVYLHSDLLTQIRDAVVGFDMDVQLGVVSQILLQLQSSYQVQMSIQNTLAGWSNASGMAVRVEMV